jgi:FKBP-type peptidyl-prolyl cis-trans isomerase FklB
MRKIKIILLVTWVALASVSNAQKSPENPKLKTNNDSVSYALGALIGKDLKNSGFSELNYKAMNIAMQRAMKGDSMLMDLVACNTTLQAAAMVEMKKKAAENELLNKAFFEKNKQDPSVVTTASGLQYKILKPGTGSKPAKEQKVKVHYTGKLIDGKIFDSSLERGQPAVFGVDQVIPGWTEALTLMPLGSKWELYIPPALGYGDQGTQGIPGGSLLIFEVELLGIE